MRVLRRARELLQPGLLWVLLPVRVQRQARVLRRVRRWRGPRRQLPGQVPGPLPLQRGLPWAPGRVRLQGPVQARHRQHHRQQRQQVLLRVWQLREQRLELPRVPVPESGRRLRQQQRRLQVPVPVLPQVPVRALPPVRVLGQVLPPVPVRVLPPVRPVPPARR